MIRSRLMVSPTSWRVAGSWRQEPDGRPGHRCLDDLDVDGGEHRVEGGGELAVAVADQEPDAPVGVVEVHE